jgi:hypothetical protein
VRRFANVKPCNAPCDISFSIGGVLREMKSTLATVSLADARFF